jgi:hypothetical protein
MKSIFVGMIFYGTLIGQIGAAVLLVGILILVVYGYRHMDTQDDEPCDSPDSAAQVPSTPEELDKEDCKSGESKF